MWWDGPAWHNIERSIQDQVVSSSRIGSPWLLAALVLFGQVARADDFVEIQTSKVWVRKGGLACGNAEDAAAGLTGFFSSCIRLPIAMQVKLIDTPEPMAQVYYMRVLDAGEKPKNAWFSRDSLTNSPRLADFVPDP